MTAERPLNDRMAVIERERRTAPRIELALVGVPRHVQPLGVERARVEQDGDVLQVALVQVGVEQVAGERRRVHQLRAHRRRVVVVGIEEPVLEADQTAGTSGLRVGQWAKLTGPAS